MSTAVTELDGLEGALIALTNKRKKVEPKPKRNHRDFSTAGFRIQIIGPGTDVERLHNELAIPQTVLRDLLNKFGFSQDTELSIIFHPEKPGFIAFQSPKIDLKKPSAYISYTKGHNGDMVLGVEGIKEGVNLRGQYEMDPLKKIFKLTSWNCIDKHLCPRFRKIPWSKKYAYPNTNITEDVFNVMTVNSSLNYH